MAFKWGLTKTNTVHKHCKFNYISVNFDRTQHVFYGFMVYKLKSEDIFTRLIRLTLFMSCFVTYTCHGFPYDKPNALE